MERSGSDLNPSASGGAPAGSPPAPALRRYQRLLHGLTTPPEPSRVRALALLLGYLVLTATLVGAHEPWRDEAESWLFARDLRLSEVRDYTRHAGTPVLWHVLLLPFAKAGLPYATQGWIHLLVAGGAIAALVARSPFSRALQLLFAASFLLSFEYVVVARSYALTVLLLFVAASLYRERAVRPLGYGLCLALLAHTNAHGAVLASAAAAALGIETLAEHRRCWRAWAGLGLVATSILFAAWLLVPPEDAGQFAYGRPRMHLDAALTAPHSAFLPGAALLPGPLATLSAPLGLVVLLLGAWALADRPLQLAVFGLGAGGLVTLFTFVYYGELRHHGMLHIVFAAALWTRAADAPRAGEVARPLGLRVALLVWGACLALSLPLAALAWHAEWTRPYSGAEEIAEVILAHDLDRQPLAAHQPPVCSAVLPYLRTRELYYPALGRAGSHMRWDEAYARSLRVHPTDAAARAQAAFGAGPWVLLLDWPLERPERYGLVPFAHTTRPPFRANDEVFFLYVTPDLAADLGANAQDRAGGAPVGNPEGARDVTLPRR